MAKIKVLVVDDDIEDFDIKQMRESEELPGYMAYYLLELQEAGFDVVISRGPRQALDVIKTFNPGEQVVVLIDVLMSPEGEFLREDPTQDGVATGLLLAKRMREQRLIDPSVPIFILSNNTPPDAQGMINTDCQQLLRNKMVAKILFKPDTLPLMLVDEIQKLYPAQTIVVE